MIRKTYIRKVEARLVELEEDIGRLKDRVAAPVGEIMERVEREIIDLRSKAAAVRKSVHDVEAAGASNWGHLKKAVDDGIKDLGRAIDETIEKVRKTGSGFR
jgi:hypothetical protein